MSVQAMTWVLENSESRLGPRHVMISIGNHADRLGKNAFPSIRTIAREARLSEREVQYAVPLLVDLGELAVKKGAGPGGTNLYSLPRMARGAKSAPLKTLHRVQTGVQNPQRNKERTKATVNLNPPLTPPENREGNKNLKIPTRKRDMLRIDQEIRRLVNSSDCPLQGKLVVIQAAVNLGFDPQYVNYMGGPDCPFHPNVESLTQNGNCWACYSETHESGCLPA